MQKILEEVSYNKLTKGPDPQRAVKYAALLNATTTDSELAAADLVIEAVVENPDVKRQVFARLEPLLRDDAMSGLEHFNHPDHATGPRAQTSRALLRHPFFQSRA